MLLLYVHGKQLWSCRNGQLVTLITLFLGGSFRLVLGDFRCGVLLFMVILVVYEHKSR